MIIKSLQSFLFLFAFLAPVSLLTAQSSYTPFLNGSQWYVSENGFFGSEYKWIMTGKDSLIAGRNYVQVLDSLSPLPRFVHEDLQTQEVWMASGYDGYQPRLLYDFSMAIGDTVALTFPGFPAMQFVLTGFQPLITTQGIRDQAILQNTLLQHPLEIRWTAGLGNNTHPFYLDYIQVSDPEYQLICNYHQGIKFFDDGFHGCPGESPALGVDVKESGLEMHAAYLPDESAIWMELPKLKGIAKWHLYGLQGNHLASGEINGGNRTLHKVNALASGTYLLLVESEIEGFAAKAFISW